MGTKVLTHPPTYINVKLNFSIKIGILYSTNTAENQIQ